MNTLRNLIKAERAAWHAMMIGSEENARSVYGEEGKNYIAWCAAADAEYSYRAANGLIGKDGRSC